MTSECPLCQKLAAIDRLSAEEVIWRFPHSVAFLGPWQYYRGYCLLVSRQHATELQHLPNAERRAFLEEMSTLARAITECFKPRKLNYELLGNQVPHLHWHLFPRYDQDPEALKPVWLALDRAERDETERQRLEANEVSRAAIGQALRTHLRQLVGGP